MDDTPENRKLVEKAVFLYKIAFSNTATRSGASVNYLSQHSMIWGAMIQKQFSTAFWLGICAGLAIEWIKSRKGGRDLMSDLHAARTEVFNKKAHERAGVEALSTVVNESHRLQNNLNLAFKDTCTSTGDPITSPFPFNNACSSFRSGNFYYISSGSHAMAVYCHGRNKLDFYDPNVGEMRGVKARDLEGYFKAASEASCIAQGISVDTLVGKKQFSIAGYR